MQLEYVELLGDNLAGLESEGSIAALVESSASTVLDSRNFEALFDIIATQRNQHVQGFLLLESRLNATVDDIAVRLKAAEDELNQVNILEIGDTSCHS